MRNRHGCWLAVWGDLNLAGVAGLLGRAGVSCDQYINSVGEASACALPTPHAQLADPTRPRATPIGFIAFPTAFFPFFYKKHSLLLSYFPRFPRPAPISSRWCVQIRPVWSP